MRHLEHNLRRRGLAHRLLSWSLIVGMVVCVPVASPSSSWADGMPEDDGGARGSKTSAASGKKLRARDAAFIIVQTDFSRATVTVDGKAYPVHSEIGAVVAPNKVYEVVVKDESSNTTARYEIKLKPGEARLIMASLSSSGGSSPRTPTRAPTQRVPNEPQKEEPVSEEPGQGSGYLTVNATPTGQVYIDGKLVASKTPLVKHQVEPGNHTVRVYYVDDKKFSETKRAMITEGRHVNLYFQNSQKR